jgi:hypothetical protein
MDDLVSMDFHEMARANTICSTLTDGATIGDRVMRRHAPRRPP